MGKQAGVLTMMVMLVALFGLVSGAAAETIKVNMDKDRVKDPVVASSPAANTTRVATLLSSRKNKFTFIDIAGSGAKRPFIKAKGDVNNGKGAELFVRTGHPFSGSAGRAGATPGPPATNRAWPGREAVSARPQAFLGFIRPKMPVHSVSDLGRWPSCEAGSRPLSSR